MNNNNLLSAAKAAGQSYENEVPPGQHLHTDNESSYRSDYSLQTIQPRGSEYTSCKWEEELPAPVSKPRLTRHLSYAERRLRSHL